MTPREQMMCAMEALIAAETELVIAEAKRDQARQDALQILYRLIPQEKE